jgi:predicted transcriptional regulator
MARTQGSSKHADITVRVSADLKDAFEATAVAADRKADDILRDLMQAYVDRRPEPEEGYDEWFRRQVQESIDDPRPSIPHEAVIEQTTDLIDRIAAGISRRED